MKCWRTEFDSKLIAIATIAIIAISASIQPVDSANILGVFLSPSPSHLIVHMSVMKSLADEGHNVTVVTGQKPKVNHEKIKNIIIEPTEAHRSEMERDLSGLGAKKQNPFVMLFNFLTADNVMFTMQYEALKNEGFQAIYESHFDLVIMGYFMNNFQFIVPAKLNIPVILTWTGQPMEFLNELVGVPNEVSYVPSLFTPHKAGEVLSYSTRIINVLSNGALSFFGSILDINLAARYKYLAAGDPTLRTYSQMKGNISLIFCNSHFSEGPIRPLVPGLVEIGGIQIKDNPDTLPKTIGDFLDASAQNGAILFSLGSNMKGSNVQPATVKIIYKVLSSLKQNVIWKWEDFTNTPGNASNILYQKWLPQDDILAHPNLKLFITHAGKGGVAEATYHGVPMVAMPVFADQPANADKIVQSGYGLQVDITNLEEDAFREALREVLNNPVYRNNVRTFSKLYRDRPLSARRNVVYWVEYVLRHRGAAHMQSTLVHMNWLQSRNLDVYLTIIVALYALWKLIKLTFKGLCRLIRLAIEKLKPGQSKKSKKA